MSSERCSIRRFDLGESSVVQQQKEREAAGEAAKGMDQGNNMAELVDQ